MMRTAAQLTTNDLAPFRETAKRRSALRHARLAQRRERALSLAHEAASFLKQHYGATKVVLFGSLTQPDAFSEVSDIDLAVEGIAQADYFLAVASLLELDGQFRIDLVDLADCTPSLAKVVAQEGKPL